jgi:hypothetical protein
MIGQYNGRDVGRTDDEECTEEQNCRFSREREEMIIDERRLGEMGTGYDGDEGVGGPREVLLDKCRWGRADKTDWPDSVISRRVASTCVVRGTRKRIEARGGEVRVR